MNCKASTRVGFGLDNRSIQTIGKLSEPRSIPLQRAYNHSYQHVDEQQNLDVVYPVPGMD